MHFIIVTFTVYKCGFPIYPSIRFKFLYPYADMKTKNYHILSQVPRAMWWFVVFSVLFYFSKELFIKEKKVLVTLTELSYLKKKLSRLEFFVKFCSCMSVTNVEKKLTYDNVSDIWTLSEHDAKFFCLLFCFVKTILIHN